MFEIVALQFKTRNRPPNISNISINLSTSLTRVRGSPNVARGAMRVKTRQGLGLAGRGSRGLVLVGVATWLCGGSPQAAHPEAGRAYGGQCGWARSGKALHAG